MLEQFQTKNFGPEMIRASALPEMIIFQWETTNLGTVPKLQTDPYTHIHLDLVQNHGTSECQDT